MRIEWIEEAIFFMFVLYKPDKIVTWTNKNQIFVVIYIAQRTRTTAAHITQLNVKKTE